MRFTDSTLIQPFFYAAAGLSFGNFLLVATMGWLERRALAAERAS